MKASRTLFISFIAYCIILIIASEIPLFGGLEKKNFDLAIHLRMDYLLHFGAYFGFFILLIIGSIYKVTIFKKNSLVRVLIITTLLAITTETLQLYVPYRTLNPVDMLFNFTGIAAGLLTCLLVSALQKSYL
jgi:VanZ family protein